MHFLTADGLKRAHQQQLIDDAGSGQTAIVTFGAMEVLGGFNSRIFDCLEAVAVSSDPTLGAAA